MAVGMEQIVMFRSWGVRDVLCYVSWSAAGICSSRVLVEPEALGLQDPRWLEATKSGLALDSHAGGLQYPVPI